MRPLHEHGGYCGFDMTEGRVHRITDPDGSVRVVAYFPKQWVGREPVPMVGVNGKTFFWTPYEVTEWEEITLATILAPTVEPEKTE